MFSTTRPFLGLSRDGPQSPSLTSGYLATKWCGGTLLPPIRAQAPTSILYDVGVRYASSRGNASGIFLIYNNFAHQ